MRSAARAPLRYRTIAILALLTGPAASSRPACAQQETTGDDTHTRQIWNDAFLQKRPGTGKPAAKAGVPAKTSSARAPDLADSLVGITIWRGEGADWKRSDAAALLVEGQRVRIGIETARSGYLYVISREQYAGGVMGDPILIFPTLRIQRGDNQVRAGRLVEIPAWSDSPPYLTVTLGRPDQIAELLTLLVTREPLANVKIAEAAVKLDPQQVAAWEQQWGRVVRQIPTRDDVGRPYLAAEREAGMRTRALQHTDPLPQTLFLCEASPAMPLLVSLPLRIAR